MNIDENFEKLIKKMDEFERKTIKRKYLDPRKNGLKIIKIQSLSSISKDNVGIMANNSYTEYESRQIILYN